MPRPATPLEPPSYSAVVLARIAVALLIGLVIAGVAIFGFSNAELERFWRNMFARPGGPMTFRFILQPIMAAIAAWKDGNTDARLARPHYLASIVRGDGDRGRLLWEGVVSTARIIILGVVMDAIYQVTVLKTFHPNEAVLIAILLAFVPYVLLRGPFDRLARRRAGRPSS
jgi:hypothetical protein